MTQVLLPLHSRLLGRSHSPFFLASSRAPPAQPCTLCTTSTRKGSASTRSRHAPSPPQPKSMCQRLTLSWRLPHRCAQKEAPDGKPTESAHPGASPAHAHPRQTNPGRLLQPNRPTPTPCTDPHPLPFCAARFSPDDKFSKQRLICKKRFNLLPMQQPKVQL